MSASDRLDPWMVAAIHAWIARGYRKDELISELERLDRAGGSSWTLRDRRTIAAAIDEMWAAASTGSVASPGAPTRAEVESKRDELAAVGLPHGQKALARALHTSQSTIRRRLSDK